MSELGYRPCVGVMLVNKNGKVFVAERLDSRHGNGHTAGFWQMPQGGVDEGEDLQEAALRELAEETGVGEDKVTILAKVSEPIRYDLPDELIGKLWKGKYRGQEQVWYLARFQGEDADIDLEAHDPPEFAQWKWLEPEELPGVIVPFKKHVYRAVLAEFQALI
ncbi:RNA pyrophosphohydrolase [Pontixanthobacter aestiaquae]|uniref:RNA pyrophosphohydrolase n=1 Tax=Pontixanthobacter aestiaquae TaxID=1509367 RepID=A0A844Z9S7_9SPHN|nr:RNA pyrophosphohydrolase [Pontixanthobacter aestiaquae]MDN3645235.1 RNA pyrophosphohydrolase [Pontixanthobacter aestiaquae]MXO83763.1 RNA pyrophosphohydrolase [Pontixanthobacter aestiaquae]